MVHIAAEVFWLEQQLYKLFYFFIFLSETFPFIILIYWWWIYTAFHSPESNNFQLGV